MTALCRLTAGPFCAGFELHMLTGKLGHRAPILARFRDVAALKTWAARFGEYEIAMQMPDGRWT